jgi:hypothetical protein
VVLLFVAGFLEMMILDNATLKLSKNWTKPTCDCLPGCHELSYSSSMTYGNIDPLFAQTNNYASETRKFKRTYVR